MLIEILAECQKQATNICMLLQTWELIISKESLHVTTLHFSLKSSLICASVYWNYTISYDTCG